MSNWRAHRKNGWQETIVYSQTGMRQTKALYSISKLSCLHPLPLKKSMIVQRRGLLILQCYRYVSTIQKACCHWWHRKQRSGISWQIGLSGVMRGSFANGTGLNNSIDSNFHPVEQFVLFLRSLLNRVCSLIWTQSFWQYSDFRRLVHSSVLNWPDYMGCGCHTGSTYPVHRLSRQNTGAERVFIDPIFLPSPPSSTYVPQYASERHFPTRILIDWNRSQMSSITLIMHLTMR